MKKLFVTYIEFILANNALIFMSIHLDDFSYLQFSESVTFKPSGFLYIN